MTGSTTRLPGTGGGALTEPLAIRPAGFGDHPALWSMLEPVFRAGDTYAVDPAITREDALAYWYGGNHTAFIAGTPSPHAAPALPGFFFGEISSGGVAEGDGGQTAPLTPLGSYYICPNQGGGGAHVCNCGFVTAPVARGRGVARAMLAHSLDMARAMGYRAMQFNFVVETNIRAIAIWQQHGFDIVGRLPGAFHHPSQGYVDALVMYRTL
jgi:ribosomal protein S18 acetylase RimI-like enzyme